MAIETVQEKNKRLTKEVQELKKALADMTDIVINKDKEIDRMRKGQKQILPDLRHICRCARKSKD